MDLSSLPAEVINEAAERVEQDALRRMAQRSAREGGPKLFFGPEDTFDRIPGGMVARRNNHVKPLLEIPDGEYGS